MDIPVFSGQSFLGMMAEEDAREVLRKKEGRLVRGDGKRKIQLNTEASVRTRALCFREVSGAAISSTQREELYSGFRREHTEGPVTGVLTVVRRPGKIRMRNHFGSEIFPLVPWNENDRFPRHRFNPDKIRPMFRSEAALRAAQAERVTAVAG
jgi:hypothetical protein